MKTVIRFIPALMAAGFILGGAQMIAQEGAKGGAAQLAARKPLVVSTQAAKPAMACSKCGVTQSVFTTESGKGRPGSVVTATQHSCPACVVTLGVEGHGKAKKDVVKHTCTATAEPKDCCKKG